MKQGVRTFLAGALAAGGACVVAAQAVDPMATPECAAARQQLDDALASAGPPGHAGRLAQARRQAALACLGRTQPAPPEGRFVPPPVAVAPIEPPAVPVLPPPQPPAAAVAPLASTRPPVITTCDAAGCWDSEGQRHNQMGPLLVGPRGLCTLQGGLLNCP